MHFSVSVPRKTKPAASWFHSSFHSPLDSKMSTGFLVSWFIFPCTLMSSGFLVSWFQALPIWTAGCRQVSWFHGLYLMHSISGQRDVDRFLKPRILWTSHCPEMECMERLNTKPRNHRHLALQRWRAWNHEKAKNYISGVSRVQIGT